MRCLVPFRWKLPIVPRGSRNVPWKQESLFARRVQSATQVRSLSDDTKRADLRARTVPSTVFPGAVRLASGSMCLRISSSKPLPQSKLPPSKLIAWLVRMFVLERMHRAHCPPQKHNVLKRNAW